MTPDAVAYQNYLRVRDAVLRMKQAGVTGTAAPSEYWNEELSNIDYMIEASPLVIRKLRHHAFQITGIRPYDYRVQDDVRSDAFKGRLQSLVELGGRELLVPEHPALGGFGYRLDAGLFNLDTIKYFEALVGMKRAGVLDALGAPGAAVLEIGGGWGGLAYQFKTLFPHLTYVIIDLPELFLFSATYLQTVFPDARIVFASEGTEAASWRDADFVFVPNTLAHVVRGQLSPALTVNLASFQEMTSEQVDGYARLAHESGSPCLYSLNRERSRYNTQLSTVSELAGRYYDLREISVLDTDYLKAMKKPGKARPASSAAAGAKRDGEEHFAYRHLAGVRRAGATAQPVGAGMATTTGSPVVALGATLYNRATYLRETLDSLLAQTYTNVRLVLVDDASSDETEAICREYAARDPRVRYLRHAERQGMVGTWRDAFEEATAASDPRYFAWASDHDLWEPRWLETLVGEMEADPSLVLAYPFTRRIGPEGELLDKPPRLFETRGLHDLDERWPFVCREHVASGDMVYGLMRVDAVRTAGVFRDVMCPDRLLMAELAQQGEFRQVPEPLWARRQFENSSSVARQRTSLFAGRAPAGRRLPPWLQHARALWRVYVTPVTDPVQRRAASRRVVQYAAQYALKHQQKTTTYRQFGAVLRSLTWTKKRVKHYTLLGVFHALVGTRRAYHRTVYEVAVFTRRIGLR